MKKTLKILFTLLFCLCPTLLLAACGSIEYYTISATSSSTSLGSVSGVPNAAVAQDSTVTLTARPNDEINHPLIAWVKNDEKLVKIPSINDGVRDNSLVVSASSESEGKYTAVFNEPNTSMMYAFLSSCNLLSIDGVLADPSSFTTSFTYAIMSAGSSTFLPFEHDLAKQPNILYFGGAGVNREYKFKVIISLTLGETTVQVEASSDEIISKTTFDDELSLFIPYAFTVDFGDGEKNCELIVSFTKFTTELYKVVDTPNA